MAFEIRPFQPEHLSALTVLPFHQKTLDVVCSSENIRNLPKDSSFSGFWQDRLVICLGLIPIWPGRATTWAFLDIDISGPGMLATTRWVINYLNTMQSEYQRIEGTVDLEFKQGHRWLIMLGFRPEGVMESYDLFGRTHLMYARIA